MPDCGQFAAVLTVLGEPPPDPEHTFRPPYWGTAKPLISTNLLNPVQLEVAAGDTYLDSTLTPLKISQDTAVRRTSHQRLDFSNSSLYGGAPLEPVEAYYPSGGTWGGDVWADDADLIYWLFSDDSCASPPCTDAEELAAKMPVLIGYVQHGVDQWGALRGGQAFLRGGGGNGAGKLLVTAFAAAMLDDIAPSTGLADLETEINNAQFDDFMETHSLKLGAPATLNAVDSEVDPLIASGPGKTTSLAGRVLWGQGNVANSTNAQNNYWTQLYSSGNSSGGGLNGTQSYPNSAGSIYDPYSWIDGGALPGTSYQRSTGQQFKYTALILRMMPELRLAWLAPSGDVPFNTAVTQAPENDERIIEYARRMVTHGAWTLPDPCKSKPELVSGQAATIPGYTTVWGRTGSTQTPTSCVYHSDSPYGPRRPGDHGTFKDGGYDPVTGNYAPGTRVSLYAEQVWDEFEASFPYSNAIPSP
jgi:hypothetical protein